MGAISENIRRTYRRFTTAFDSAPAPSSALPAAPRPAPAASSASRRSVSTADIQENLGRRGCSRKRDAGCPAPGTLTCASIGRLTVSLPIELPSSYDLSTLPDADVATLANEGREAAFRELVHRYERPVFSLIFRMVRDRETAEDLAQDTFVRVLNHIDRYRPEFKFSSWLFKIANNLTIDHLRKRQLDTISIEGSPHAATTAEAEATSVDVRSHDESPLEEIESRELGSAIERAIAHLRPEYRSCILLRHVEGRSLRGNSCHPRPAPWDGQNVHPPRPARAPGRPGTPAVLT